MIDTILITKNNYIDIIESLKYGPAKVSFESETVKKLCLYNIEIINHYYNSNAIRITESINDRINDGEIISTVIDGVYNLLYAKTNPVPKLHFNNYRLKDLCIEAYKNKSVVKIDGFDESLSKYAKKLAKEYDIKFAFNCFNGKVKNKSLSSQLKESYLRGDYFFETSINDINIQSLRNAVSQLNSASGQKITVKANNGKVTVFFKEPTESWLATENIDLAIKTLLKTESPRSVLNLFEKRLEYFEKIIKGDIKQTLPIDPVIIKKTNSVQEYIEPKKEYSDMSPEEKQERLNNVPGTEPIWKAAGYNSQDEYDAYEEF